MSRDYRSKRLNTDDKENPKFVAFDGVVNTRSRKDLGWTGLYQGTNVTLSDSKKLTRLPGYSLYYSGDVRAVYGLDDKLYVVDGGTLRKLTGPTTYQDITTGLADGAYSWEEVNGDIHFVNGTDAGIVRSGQYLPWRLESPSIVSIDVVDAGAREATPLNMGARYDTALFRFVATYTTDDGRETAPSAVVAVQASPLARLFRVTVPVGYARTNIYMTLPDGTEFRCAASVTSPVFTVTPAQRAELLLSLGTSSMPPGIERVAFFEGSFYGAYYMAQEDQTVLWRSDALAAHLWRPDEEGLVVPGRVSMLMWITTESNLRVHSWLLIGSTQRVWVYNAEENLIELCDYGVLPGEAGDITAEGVAYFWTARGFCKAMPFANITEEKISMPPGLVARSKLLYLGGTMQFVTLTNGSSQAFNQRSERS